MSAEQTRSHTICWVSGSSRAGIAGGGSAGGGTTGGELIPRPVRMVASACSAALISSGANTWSATLLWYCPMSMVRAGSIRWLKKPLTMSVNTTPAVTSTGAPSIAARTRSALAAPA
ncbi:Uncharacterised protein [Mycobacterium tuberculosis]|uniref:Uncharacterized protein n=2 Tax=Mycobacterium tuberculosis TaxID=1773 RepID=A0A654TH87_MYCTX|nr:Uncharacterised protein [Mycobacterium tuberculosis]